jgi:hypothetical protein
LSSLSVGVRAIVLMTVVAGTTARAADAQQVLLQIRPHAGDTLHMRLDQEVDMSRTAGRSGGDSITTVTTTTLFVLMRTIVERSDSAGSDVTAVTDSVASVAAGARGGEAGDQLRRALQGRRVHMHVAHDGATVVIDPQDEATPELREVLAEVPATLPQKPIKVGHTWERTMAAPLGRAFAGRGEIKARFSLDSISRSRDSAFVSMRGKLGTAGPGPGPDGATATSTVSVVGTMLIDRRRGWLADSHFIIVVQSVFTPPPSAGVDLAPLRLRMTATQWLRTVDRP